MRVVFIWFSDFFEDILREVMGRRFFLWGSASIF